MLKPATCKMPIQWNSMRASQHITSKQLVFFATASVYLNNGTETVENDCLCSQCFTCLNVQLSGVAHTHTHPHAHLYTYSKRHSIWHFQYIHSHLLIGCPQRTCHSIFRTSLTSIPRSFLSRDWPKRNS